MTEGHKFGSVSLESAHKSYTAEQPKLYLALPDKLGNVIRVSQVVTVLKARKGHRQQLMLGTVRGMAPCSWISIPE